jgi:hypothetical protein
MQKKIFDAKGIVFIRELTTSGTVMIKTVSPCKTKQRESVPVL